MINEEHELFINHSCFLYIYSDFIFNLKRKKKILPILRLMTLPSNFAFSTVTFKLNIPYGHIYFSPLVITKKNILNEYRGLPCISSDLLLTPCLHRDCHIMWQLPEEYTSITRGSYQMFAIWCEA